MRRACLPSTPRATAGQRRPSRVRVRRGVSPGSEGHSPLFRRPKWQCGCAGTADVSPTRACGSRLEPGPGARSAHRAGRGSHGARGIAAELSRSLVRRGLRAPPAPPPRQPGLARPVVAAQRHDLIGPLPIRLLAEYRRRGGSGGSRSSWSSEAGVGHHSPQRASKRRVTTRSNGSASAGPDSVFARFMPVRSVRAKCSPPLRRS